VKLSHRISSGGNSVHSGWHRRFFSGNCPFGNRLAWTIGVFCQTKPFRSRSEGLGKWVNRAERESQPKVARRVAADAASNPGESSLLKVNEGRISPRASFEGGILLALLMNRMPSWIKRTAQSALQCCSPITPSPASPSPSRMAPAQLHRYGFGSTPRCRSVAGVARCNNRDAGEVCRRPIESV